MMSRSGKPRVFYPLGRREVGLLQRGLGLLSEVFLAAGAKAVYLPLRKYPLLTEKDDLKDLAATRLRARDFELTAYHPLGSARMAMSSREGVVDTNHEVYGTKGLHIVDASSVPTSLGVNPQITIMAMATRAAERISRQLNGSAP